METFSIITMFHTLERDKEWDSLDFSSSRCVGAYPNFEDACKAVIHNSCDICETCYHYALVQELEFGLYPLVKRQKLFQTFNITKIDSEGKEYYNTDLMFTEIPVPDFVSRTLLSAIIG